jgi:hypothetical protein
MILKIKKAIARILGGDEAGKGAAARGECLEIAFFTESSRVEHDDAIGVSNGAETMGNCDHCPTGRKPVQRFLDESLALIIECGSGLIEDEHGRVAQNGPGNGEALALAPRQRHASFTHEGAVALREIQDKFLGVGLACRGPQFGVRRLRPGKAEIVRN